MINLWGSSLRSTPHQGRGHEGGRRPAHNNPPSSRTDQHRLSYNTNRINRMYGQSSPLPGADNPSPPSHYSSHSPRNASFHRSHIWQDFSGTGSVDGWNWNSNDALQVPVGGAYTSWKGLRHRFWDPHRNWISWTKRASVIYVPTIAYPTTWRTHRVGVGKFRTDDTISRTLMGNLKPHTASPKRGNEAAWRAMGDPVCKLRTCTRRSASGTHARRVTDDRRPHPRYLNNVSCCKYALRRLSDVECDFVHRQYGCGGGERRLRPIFEPLINKSIKRDQLPHIRKQRRDVSFLRILIWVPGMTRSLWRKRWPSCNVACASERPWRWIRSQSGRK